MSPQPYQDTEPDSPTTYECALCGADVPLEMHHEAIETAPGAWRYVAYWRCADRTACVDRQGQAAGQSPEAQGDAAMPQEEPPHAVDWI